MLINTRELRDKYKIGEKSLKTAIALYDLEPEYKAGTLTLYDEELASETVEMYLSIPESPPSHDYATKSQLAMMVKSTERKRFNEWFSAIDIHISGYIKNKSGKVIPYYHIDTILDMFEVFS